MEHMHSEGVKESERVWYTATSTATGTATATATGTATATQTQTLTGGMMSLLDIIHMPTPR
jgi:hypothetical protein